MLLDAELTLEKAIDIANANERATNEAKDMSRQERENAMNINEVYKERTKPAFFYNKCRNCGRSHERDRSKCPAFEKKCFNCN